MTWGIIPLLFEVILVFVHHLLQALSTRSGHNLLALTWAAVFVFQDEGVQSAIVVKFRPSNLTLT